MYFDLIISIQTIMKKPIILLAFANDHPDNSGYLRDLPKEMGQLQKIAEKAVESGLCELVIRPNIDIKDLLETIRKYRQQLIILLEEMQTRG